MASSHSEIILPLLFDAKAFLHHDQKELMCVEEFQDIENEFVWYFCLLLIKVLHNVYTKILFYK